MKDKVIVYNLLDLDNIDGMGADIMTGTIEDIRTFMKNRWNECDEFVAEMLGFEVEEDYYTYIDDDTNLFIAIRELGYIMDEVCVVPIEDFRE